MKLEQREYCQDRSECPAGHSCLSGKCVEDITPPPPGTTNRGKKDKPKQNEG